jgi:hypothetical protein
MPLVRLIADFGSVAGAINRERPRSTGPFSTEMEYRQLIWVEYGGIESDLGGRGGPHIRDLSGEFNAC